MEPPSSLFKHVPRSEAEEFLFDSLHFLTLELLCQVIAEPHINELLFSAFLLVKKHSVLYSVYGSFTLIVR